MPKVAGGIVIERPVHEVFNYAISAESHLQWVPGIRDAAYLDDGPVRVGSHWRATITFAGCRLESVNEIVALEVNRCFEWRSVGGPVRSSGSYVFTPLDAGVTRFAYQLLSDDKMAALVGGLALPLALRLVRREIGSRLQRVKASLEAGEIAVA